MFPSIVEQYKGKVSQGELKKCFAVINAQISEYLPYFRRTGVNIMADDLRNAGLLGLHIAISNYKSELGDLNNYSREFIRREILQAIEDQRLWYGEVPVEYTDYLENNDEESFE